MLLSDPVFLAAAAVAVAVLGLSKGGFVGLGVAAVPTLALAVPPQQAVAILLPVILAQDVYTVWVYRRDFSAWNLKVLLPGGALGTLLAWAFAASLSIAAVKLTVGLLALFFVVTRVAGPRLERLLPKPSAGTGLVFGAISGFASTIANAGAPTFQMHMLPQRLATMTFVGTTALFFAFSNVLKIPAYYALGTLTQANVTLGLALVPLAVATNFLGVWLMRRVSTELFYRIAYVLIFVLSLELIRSGADELLR